jgi:tetratricopeptide (TPR) repeat protein
VAADTARDGVAFARRVGNRYWEWSFLAQMYAPFALGDWNEVLSMYSQLPTEDWSQARLAFVGVLSCWIPVQVHRGNIAEAEALLEMLAEFETSADVQERMSYHHAKACVALAHERHADALAMAETAMEVGETIGISSEGIKESFAVAVASALVLDDLERAQTLIAEVDALPPGRSPQFLQAQVARFRAALATRREDIVEAERLFKQAAGRFRELSVPFYLALVLLEHSEWLAMQDRADEAAPLLAEARETFERLGATPWLERLERLDALAPTRSEIPA